MHTKGLEPGGDEITGRRLLMWNADVEISLCRPSEQMDYFFRNGEGDEVIFVHEGSGVFDPLRIGSITVAIARSFGMNASGLPLRCSSMCVGDTAPGAAT